MSNSNHTEREFLTAEVERLRLRVMELERGIPEARAQARSLPWDPAVLSSVLNNVPQSIFWKDRESVFLGCNEAFARAAGLQRPDLIIGKTDFDLGWPKEEAEAYRTDDREVMQNNRAKRHIIEPLRQADGARLWIDTTKVPLHDDQGRVVGVLGVYDDITERRRVEEELRSSQAMFQLVLDTIPARVFWKDRRSVYLGCNQLFAHDAGLSSPDEIVGKEDSELVWREQADAYRADDRAVMTTGRPKIGYEEEETTPQGTRIWLRTSKVPLFDQQGDVIGVLGTYENIMAHKQAEEALLRTTQELDRFFSLTLDLLCIADTDGRFLRLNQAWEDTLGYSVEELEGRELIELVHPEDRQATLEAVRRLAEGQSVMDFVNRYRRKDGAYRWIEWRSVSYQGKWIYAAARDITGRIQGEHELRTQNNFRRAIIDRAAEGLCVCHEVGEFPFVRFTVWNDRMTEITGYCMEEVNRLGWYQTLYPDPEVQERARARMAAMREGRDLIAEEWEITRKDGQMRVIAISTSLILAQDQQHHVLALMHDLTDRKRAEEERRRLEDQFQHVQKLESLGVLAGGIAHDFNNLLMAVLGNADLALRQLGPASPARSFLQGIQTASCRAAELCRQMLAYAGKGRFVVEPLNLNDVVEEMTSMLEVSISKKARLTFKLAPGLPAVDADATQLRQVLMNLITNASEAIGDRSGAIEISTGVVEIEQAGLNSDLIPADMPAGTYVFVEVSDTGCGMTPEVKGRMFDPFFTTKFTGRGLGMAAVLGIMRGHGGAVEVRTEPDKGTAIRALLPVSFTAPMVRAAPPAPDVDWRGSGTILVVEDEDSVRTLARTMLEYLGFGVVAVGDGWEAVRTFRERRGEIACVLLDLTMPRMDGEETLQELRRIDEDVRVVLSSGYNEQEVTQRFVGQGLAGFIQKPYQVETLKERLRAVLGE
jgi:PAS domain S-box-containing protein